MFSYEMPTKVFFGRDCLQHSGEAISALGHKAMLVTGRRSAKANGAQDAVQACLRNLEIDWCLFDEVESNPSIETVRRAANLAKAEAYDVIIAIGGGSPMDAGKVIALLCTNTLDDERLFTGPYARPLPIVTVPTTAGTGSEVTKVGVLTNHCKGTKESVADPLLFPTLSYVDPSFTMSVSEKVTIDTAIDALSHAVEGYLSKRATPMSDVWAEEAMRFIGGHLTELKGKLPYSVREDLLYGSMLAGITIAQTGTTLVHGMGYQLTYYKDLSHGRANGLLLPAYMALMSETMPHKTERIWDILSLSGITDFRALMVDLMPEHVALTAAEIDAYVELTMRKTSVAVTAYPVTAAVVAELYKSLS